jgi:hypothetical protein
MEKKPTGISTNAGGYSSLPGRTAERQAHRVDVRFLVLAGWIEMTQ